LTIADRPLQVAELWRNSPENPNHGKEPKARKPREKKTKEKKPRAAREKEDSEHASPSDEE